MTRTYWDSSGDRGWTEGQGRQSESPEGRRKHEATDAAVPPRTAGRGQEREAAAAGGSLDCIGDFIEQERGRRKVYPIVKKEVVPEGKGLRRPPFILQLPLQHDRRIRHGGGSPVPPFPDQFRDRNTNGSNLLPEPIHFRNQELVSLSPIAFHRGPFQFLEGVLQRALTITMAEPSSRVQPKNQANWRAVRRAAHPCGAGLGSEVVASSYPIVPVTNSFFGSGIL